jgi:hypothetical protein
MPEPTEDVTLKIIIARPRADLPQGMIRMTAKTKTAEGPKHEEPFSGPCEDGSITRCVDELVAYFRYGTQSFRGRIRPDNNGHSPPERGR